MYMFLASDDAGVGVYGVTQSVGVDVLGAMAKATTA